MKRKWYAMSRVQNADRSEAEITIFDEIGMWGVTAKDFKAEFDAVKDADAIKVSINSPGGSVFDGMTIYQMLAKERDRVQVEVYGIAASIASIIALAGSTMTVARGGYYMIHNPFTFAMGTAEDMRKTAGILDKMRADLGSIYAEKSGMSEDEVYSLMDAETWYTADEAREAGFADDISDYGDIAARMPDLTPFNFANTPRELLEHEQPRASIETARQFERYLRDAGFSRTEAQAITANGFRAMQGEPAEPIEQGEPVSEPKRLTPRQRILRAQVDSRLRRIGVASIQKETSHA